MKQFIPSVLLALSLISISPITQASTSQAYVSDAIHTYLRRGPGDKYRISARITAGTPVIIISKKDRYSLIKYNNNSQGWILNSELSSTESPRTLVPKLENKIQDLTAKLNNIDSDWQKRTSSFQNRLKIAETQSSQLVEINSQLKRQLSELTNHNQSLETRLDAKKQDIATRWFIYGGSVLFFGLLLGVILPYIIPRRRKKSNWS